jgi:hypothetical protein
MVLKLVLILMVILPSIFNVKGGLRQGDPFSPFLFELVTDTLCQIMNRGIDLNLIQGLGPRLSNGHKCSYFCMLMILSFFYQQF